MRFINMARQSGKTTSLIYASYVTGTPILVKTANQANFILKQAKELGIKELNVYTLDYFIRSKGLIQADMSNGILIDEAQDIIEMALQSFLGVQPIAATFSIDMITANKLIDSPLEKITEDKDK